MTLRAIDLIGRIGRRLAPAALAVGLCAAAPAMAAPKKTLLFFVANPVNTAALDGGSELNEVQDVLARSPLAVVDRPAVSPEDFTTYFLRHDDTAIVHFTGHGTRPDVILENAEGEPLPVSAEKFASLFNAWEGDNRVAVLNACFSDLPARRLVEDGKVECAIGWERPVPDRTARLFARGFYRAIGYGRSVANARQLGRDEVIAGNVEIPDGEPQLRCRPGVDASQLKPVGAGQAALQVSTNPIGASVTIDEGRAQITTFNTVLTPGIHRLRFERSGYLPQSREVDLAPGSEMKIDQGLTPTWPLWAGGGGVVLGIALSVGLWYALPVRQPDVKTMPDEWTR